MAVHVWKGSVRRLHLSSLRERPTRGRVRCSDLFLPRSEPDLQQATVDSHKLMLRAGLVRQSSAGVYHLLPLAVRALERLVGVVDRHMKAIGGAKVALPILTPAAQWRTSGRWDTMGSELFRLKSSTGAEYCLGPTHEEAVAELVSSEVTSHRQLPLRLYQLDRKFRDEKRPRYGLLRCKEFWMKDMYTFDVGEEEAISTYQEVCAAYENIFRTLSLPVIKVSAHTGNIGGTLSHEYHVTSSVGEDTLLLCRSCGQGCNKELLCAGDALEHSHTPSSLPDCPQDGRDCQLEETKGIEVAHAFFLGTKYSSVFGASFGSKDTTQKLCQMGCYGVGISRLLQAAIQHSCSLHGDSEHLVWPLSIAPYITCILPLTTSRDPSDPIMVRAQRLYDLLSEEACPDHVILDDRTYLTMGARLRDAQLQGYPCTIVLGYKTPEGQYEVRVRADGGEAAGGGGGGGSGGGGLETRLLSESDTVQTVRSCHSQSTALPL